MDFFFLRHAHDATTEWRHELITGTIPLKHPGVKCLIQVLIGVCPTSYRDQTTNLLVTSREHKPLHQLMPNLKMMAYSLNIKYVHGYKVGSLLNEEHSPCFHALSLWILSALYFSVFQVFISITLPIIWLWCIITPCAWAFREMKIIIMFWHILTGPVWRCKNDSI